jgi:hypothetical protein
MRDEVDVVQLEDLAGASETPIDGGEEGAFEAGELGGGKPAYARVVGVGAERIAVGFGGKGDGGDDEAMYGKGGYRKGWLACADLIDVVQDEEEAGLLLKSVIIVGVASHPAGDQRGRYRGKDKAHLEIGEAYDTPEIVED